MAAIVGGELKCKSDRTDAELSSHCRFYVSCVGRGVLNPGRWVEPVEAQNPRQKNRDGR